MKNLSGASAAIKEYCGRRFIAVHKERGHTKVKELFGK